MTKTYTKSQPQQNESLPSILNGSKSMHDIHVTSKLREPPAAATSKSDPTTSRSNDLSISQRAKEVAAVSVTDQGTQYEQSKIDPIANEIMHRSTQTRDEKVLEDKAILTEQIDLPKLDQES